MKLIVISPEAEVARESAVVAQLFATGLMHYHLRKPAWGRGALATFLRAVPAEFHPRVVLHSHHELAATFKIGGLHFRDAEISRHGASAGPTTQPLPTSRAVHDLGTLRVAINAYDRILFSPVFASISKPGYEPDPRISHTELKPMLALPRRTEVFALGGVDCSRLPVCHDIGFDGVAVLGAIWQSADPVRAFHELQQALLAHAA